MTIGATICQYPVTVGKIAAIDAPPLSGVAGSAYLLRSQSTTVAFSTCIAGQPPRAQLIFLRSGATGVRRAPNLARFSLGCHLCLVACPGSETESPPVQRIARSCSSRRSGRCGKSFGQELCGGEVAVEVAGCDQFGVGSIGSLLARRHDHDLLGACDGGESVSDDDDGGGSSQVGDDLP